AGAALAAEDDELPIDGDNSRQLVRLQLEGFILNRRRAAVAADRRPPAAVAARRRVRGGLVRPLRGGGLGVVVVGPVPGPSGPAACRPARSPAPRPARRNLNQTPSACPHPLHRPCCRPAFSARLTATPHRARRDRPWIPAAQ